MMCEKVNIYLYLLLILLGFFLGCNPSAEGRSGLPKLEPVNFKSLLTAPLNPLLLITGVPNDIKEESLWLVAGEVSDTSSTRFQEGIVSQSLQEARIASVVWRGREESSLYLQPQPALVPQTVFTVLSMQYGKLGVFFTSDPFENTWYLKGASSLRPSGSAFICSTNEPLVRHSSQSVSVELERIRERFNLFDLNQPDGCHSIKVSSGGMWLVLPEAENSSEHSLANTLIIAHGEACRKRDSRSLLPCKDDELPCVVPGRSGLVLKLNAGIHQVRSDNNHLIVELDERHEMRVFELDADEVIEVSSYDSHGCLAEFSYQFSPQKTVYSLIIEEVLANPVGPEPQSEWVELKNYGATAIDLRGYQLRDAGGLTPLPHVEIGPHQTALVIRSDFQANAEIDFLPHPEAIALPVLSLGHSGLLNSGEVLELLDDRGLVISRFDAGATTAGTSQVRSYPELNIYSNHPEPGASPGF